MEDAHQDLNIFFKTVHLIIIFIGSGKIVRAIVGLFYSISAFMPSLVQRTSARLMMLLIMMLKFNKPMAFVTIFLLLLLPKLMIRITGIEINEEKQCDMDFILFFSSKKETKSFFTVIYQTDVVK